MNASQFAKPGQLKLPGRGGASAPAAPLMPTQGVFRQKPWLPWWLLPLLLLLLLLLFLFLRSQPQTVLVPKVVGEKSDVRRREEADRGRPQARPQPEGAGRRQGRGGHDPRADAEGGREGREGHAGRGPGRRRHRQGATCPNITGKTAADADKAAARRRSSTLGQASPQPVDPKARSSSPDPGRGRGRQGRHAGQHLLRRPGRRRQQEEERQEGRQGARTAPAGGGGGGGGGGGDAAAADIIIPAIGKDDVDAYAKKVADLGIVPTVRKEFNDAPKGTLFATEPPGGTKVAPKSKVTLLVSVGQPQVVYTNGKNILRLNGANGAKLDPVATSPDEERTRPGAADGEHVAYVADGRVMLKDLTKKNSAAVALSPAGREFADLAWAPTADRNVLAMDEVARDAQGFVTDTRPLLRRHQVRRHGDQLPQGAVVRGHPRHLHWAPDGRSLLGVGLKTPLGRRASSGSCAGRSRRTSPPSRPTRPTGARASFVTDIDTPDKGVLDAEVSPDGKRLALVSNLGSSAFRLWLADDPEDFALLERQADRRARLQGHLARRLQGVAGGPGRRERARRTSP